jgi:hypothetical protein
MFDNTFVSWLKVPRTILFGAMGMIVHVGGKY